MLAGTCAAALFLCWGLTLALAKPDVSPRPAPDPKLGEVVYQESCARCHGPAGAGDGPDAKRMEPKPRNLAEGIFKFRTTASGTPPTDEDLFRTLSTGLPGSRMPDFQRLPEETRWQLVYHVKSLSKVFEETRPEPIHLGTDPGSKGANLEKGKELFAQLGCVACHGTHGRGDGPSAATLVDNWGLPIRAADLTHGYSYRAGSSAGDVVARLLAGIDGTPMPSYVDAVSKEDAWQLAYYVRSIQEKPRWARAIEAVRVEGELPGDPSDARWDSAPRADLRLAGSLYREGKVLPAAVTAVMVKALYNDKEIAFRLAWHDPSRNDTEPADRASLFLIPDRRAKFQIGSLRSWPASSDAPSLEQLAWSAEGTSGKAAFADGRWELVVSRPLSPAGGVGLTPEGRPILLGIAVWDGGNGETDRHRANSNWVDLVLK